MLLWEKRTATHPYPVRSAGQSLRLYTNGVFHSQYRAGSILNGGVWDLLWLPLFFKPTEQIASVLILGLGSGAAAAKIQRFFPTAEITAVEIDRWHISVAKKFNVIDTSRVTVVCADAKRWLKESCKQTYDVIIDDLYGESNGEPVRVIDYQQSNSHWLRIIKKHLRKNGLFIMNGLVLQHAREMLATATTKPTPRFSEGFVFRQGGYENIVAVLSNNRLMRRQYETRLALTLGQQPGRGSLAQLASMSVRRLSAKPA